MKKFTLILYLLIVHLLLCCFSCSHIDNNKNQQINKDNSVRIGTFNIEWLGDGEKDTKDRTEEDYKLIADIIEKTGCDIFGLQEIENLNALNRLLKYLPDYKGYVLDKGGNQNLAFIYKSSVSIDTFYEYSAVAINPTRNRPGLVVHARKGNFDWIMMIVHFKATSRFDDTEEKRLESLQTRAKQAEIVSLWIDSVLTNSNEQDVIIVGDLNDNPRRGEKSAIYPLKGNKNIEILTENEQSCKNEKWEVIDHIVVTKSAKNRYIKNTLFIENFYSMYDTETAKKISDHCPVGVSFDIIQPDND